MAALIRYTFSFFIMTFNEFEMAKERERERADDVLPSQVIVLLKVLNGSLMSLKEHLFLESAVMKESHPSDSSTRVVRHSRASRSID